MLTLSNSAVLTSLPRAGVCRGRLPFVAVKGNRRSGAGRAVCDDPPAQPCRKSSVLGERVRLLAVVGIQTRQSKEGFIPWSWLNSIIAFWQNCSLRGIANTTSNHFGTGDSRARPTLSALQSRNSRPTCLL